MRRAELVKRLIAADEPEQRRMLREHPRLADEKLAEAIKDSCQAFWASDPVSTRHAAAALHTLAKLHDRPPIRAFEHWTSGIADITAGRFESAVAALDSAAAIFKQLGHRTDAAHTQVAKLLALAMLGRYDDAVLTGRQALRVLSDASDELAAAKIEMNLNNILSRQGHHRQAEKFCASALRRFIRCGEKSWQAMAENGLANIYLELNMFKKAARFYKLALAGATQQKMFVTQAEIEASLGNLALLRGQFAEALKYFELSRQKYNDLGMPHQSAIADLEIADIYLELNLTAEAIETYGRLIPVLHDMKLLAEEGRAVLNFGRAAARVGNTSEARSKLNRALKVFELIRNGSGLTSALLSHARLAIEANDGKAALKLLAAAEKAARQQDNPRHFVDIQLLEGEAYRQTRTYPKAETLLIEAHAMARQRQHFGAAQTALTSLGKIAVQRGERAAAKRYFKNAIRVVEELRSTVRRDELSRSFLASRLEPYQLLTELLLADGQTMKAFMALEKGRSRALLDSIETRPSESGVPLKMLEYYNELRARLNFSYKRLDGALPDEVDKLGESIRETEAELSETNRKINSLASISYRRAVERRRAFGLKDLQNKLGAEKSLVEYVQIGDKISAFVINNKGIRVFENLAEMNDVSRGLENLHFQFGAMRFGAAALGRFAGQMKCRCDRVLEDLYDKLLRPIEKYLKGNGLVIVPVGLLHYVPFNALRSDNQYLIERFEITHAPSAGTWSRLQERSTKPMRRPLLIGFADERIPLVEQEIRALKKILPTARVLTGKRARFSTFIREAPNHDLIHLACHGQFRPENPMFSSLHLADGWVTVHDIVSRPLSAELVTLSACETGLSSVFAGDEILGLARGFLMAGVGSLVVSLWAVNDAAARLLMTTFYENLQLGMSVASSLRAAQREAIDRKEHPFLWAPFVLIGR